MKDKDTKLLEEAYNSLTGEEDSNLDVWQKDLYKDFIEKAIALDGPKDFGFILIDQISSVLKDKPELEKQIIDTIKRTLA